MKQVTEIQLQTESAQSRDNNDLGPILLFEEVYELFIIELQKIANFFIEFWRDLGENKQVECIKL